MTDRFLAYQLLSKISRFMPALLIVGLAAAALPVSAAPGPVAKKDGLTIHANYPGGNVKVESIDGDKVVVAPDLRGGKPWFYWNFEVTAAKAGRVDFKVLGKEIKTSDAVGNQGPAVSTDGGETWAYAGVEFRDGSSFYYEFTKPNQTVRFSVTLPYTQETLEKFLDANAANTHLKRGVLTKSLKGRDVELLQIGTPGAGKKAVLMTARHHACETIASYLLEGFMAKAIEETPEGKDFRNRFVLYVVPFVDKDGVEDGDQGKNRAPHDHNRDYGEGSLYPEVDAIEKLAADKNIRLMLDHHCPTLLMDSHQVAYFVGTKQHPENNFSNVSAFGKLMKANFPENSPAGPLNWMKDRQPMPTGSNCNRYFSFLPNIIMAVTLEFPYAPKGRVMTQERCREYGHAEFKAWVAMDFKESPATEKTAAK